MSAKSKKIKQDTKPPSSEVVLHGQCDDGQWRIKLSGKQFLASAAVYELIPEADGNSSLHLIRRIVGATHGYHADVKGEVSLVARGAKTTTLYRVIGVLKDYVSKGVALPEQVAQKPPLAPIIETMFEPANRSVSAAVCKKVKTPARSEREKKALLRELESVAAQRQAGFDPLVTISLASHITKRSRATLYRDFGKSLPLPTKIGRNSFLKYSTVEHYMSGESEAGK
jgi:hypothetical protein